MPFAGIVLSTLVLFATAFLGNVAKDFILETMARAEFVSPRKVSPVEKRGRLRFAFGLGGLLYSYSL
jgi:hypothetical protein